MFFLQHVQFVHVYVLDLVLKSSHPNIAHTVVHDSGIPLTRYSSTLLVPLSQRRRINTEEKAKVVADVYGTEFIKFLASLATVFCTRAILKNRMKSSWWISSYFQFVLVQNNQRCKELNKFWPPKQQRRPLSFLLYLSFFYGLSFVGSRKCVGKCKIVGLRKTGNIGIATGTQIHILPNRIFNTVPSMGESHTATNNICTKLGTVKTLTVQAQSNDIIQRKRQLSSLLLNCSEIYLKTVLCVWCGC